MERASRVAYAVPLLAIVSPKVANATEGAAPNSPAKLLGFNTSPRAENSATTIPPTKKRKSISLNGITRLHAALALLQGSHSIFDPSTRFLRSFHVQDPVLFAGEFMVVDKKLFQFPDEFLAEVIDVSYMRVAVVHLLYGHDTIIAYSP